MSANDQNNSAGGRLIVCFRDKDKNKAPLTLDHADASYLKKMNDDGFGIFETANSFYATDEQLEELARKKGKDKVTKRNKEFLVRLNEVFADLDICKDSDGTTEKEREARKKLLKREINIHCPASVYIITKNGLQPRWWINEENIDEATQQKYIDITNGIIEWSKQNGAKGDPVKDVTRILRKAGYYHHKSDPYLVTEEKGNEKVYTLDELKNYFWSKPEQKQQDFAPKGNSVFEQINSIPIERIAIDAWDSLGHKAVFDKDGHLIVDGEMTATFRGRLGNGNYIATTSSDFPAKGNAITYVADTLNISKSEAFKKICSKYRIERNDVEYHEPLEVITAKDLCNQEFPEVEWMIHRIIPENQITVVSGAPSSFKTMSAMEWAIQVASGGKAYGYFGTTQSPVLLVSEDGDHKRIIKKRILFLTEKPGENLYVMAGLGFKATEDDIRTLSGIVKKLKIKFVILDSFRGIMPPDADEKDASAVRGIIDNLRILTGVGATILILHHDRKKPVQLRGYTSTDPNDLGEMMSGSADIRGAVDCHLAMGSAKDKKEGRHFIIVTQTKCREDELFPAFKIVVNTPKDENGKTTKMELVYEGEYKLDNAGETMEKARNAIMDLISKSSDQYTARQSITDSGAGGFSPRTLDKALKSLEEDSTLASKTGKELEKEKNEARKKFFFIPDENEVSIEDAQRQDKNDFNF